jgi:hypothetical protein
MAGRDVEELEDLDELLGGKGGLPQLNLGQGALGKAQDLAELALGQTSALPEVTQLGADEASGRGFVFLCKPIIQAV